MDNTYIVPINKYLNVMKFQGYYNNCELFLKVDEQYYDFPNGIVCSINDVTYLAINISHFNTKESIVYALFDWAEQDYNDRESCIKKAVEISDCILPFANCTIESALNCIMPFSIRDEITASFKHCKGQPFSLVTSITPGLNVSLKETQNNNYEKSWTIVIDDKEIITLNNDKRARDTFYYLLRSVKHYITVWFKSMNK